MTLSTIFSVFILSKESFKKSKTLNFYSYIKFSFNFIFTKYICFGWYSRDFRKEPNFIELQTFDLLNKINLLSKNLIRTINTR